MVFYRYFLNEPHVHEQAFSTSFLGPADQQSFFCVQEECALWSVFKGFSGFLVASDITIIRYHEQFLFDNPNTTCWYLLVASGSVFPHWKSHCFFEHLAHRISNQEEIQDCITHSLQSFISPSQSHRSFFILKWSLIGGSEFTPMECPKPFVLISGEYDFAPNTGGANKKTSQSF